VTPSRSHAPHAWLTGLEPVRVDAVAAVVLLAAIELQIWLDPAAHHSLPAALGGLVTSVAVALRRRWPLTMLVVGVAATVTQHALGGTRANIVATIVVGVLLAYGAGAFLPERRARIALALGAAGLSIDVLITTRAAGDLFFDVVIIALLPWVAGRTARKRGARESSERESAEQLDAERELRAQAAAHRERTRIARELHDVIAHSVSVMVIQAGGARVVMDSDRDRAEDSLRLVERAGRDALAEMRRLLGALDSGADPRALAPLPRLAEIEQLVLRTRAAGLATALEVEGDVAAVSPAFDLCAYRIVQEALTNAIKHAGPADVRVVLRWVPDALELEVSDNGRGPGTATSGSSGHGIAGMRERVALHGGSVYAGANAGGGFAVRARLPLTPEFA
jgi:signal transduction histidine kinase